MQNDFDIIIIGGGPAGCAAAMFVARCKWRTLLIDRGSPGSHLASVGNVSCFPGFPESISGTDLLSKIRKQAELEGVKFAKDSVTAIGVDTKPIKVMTDSGGEYECKAVIIATGAANKSNYLYGEKEFLGKGVFEDVVLDAPSITKRIAAVIGRNKPAADAAIYISRFADKVHFVIPSSKLDIGQNILDTLASCKNVEMHYSTSLKKIQGDGHVKKISVLSSGQEKEMEVSGVFSFVHDYQPTTGFLDKTLELGDHGAVKVDENLATSAENVFACGDVLCARPQLPAISAAQGVLAGMKVDRKLLKL